MPRILRNYLISFAILGFIFLVVHLLDLYFKSGTEQKKGTSTQNSMVEPSPPKATPLSQ